jgi:hypothetical protein
VTDKLCCAVLWCVQMKSLMQTQSRTQPPHQQAQAQSAASGQLCWLMAPTQHRCVAQQQQQQQQQHWAWGLMLG